MPPKKNAIRRETDITESYLYYIGLLLNQFWRVSDELREQAKEEFIAVLQIEAKTKTDRAIHAEKIIDYIDYLDGLK